MSSLKTSLAESMDWPRVSQAREGDCADRPDVDGPAEPSQTTDRVRAWNASQRNFGDNSHP